MRVQSLIVAGLLFVGSAVAAQTATPSLAAREQQLAARFQLLAQRAVAPAASRADREALVTFLRADVLPYLAREGAVVYPVVDSIIGTDGYVTVAASFDQDAITSSVNELAAQTTAKDPTRFVGQTYAVAALLNAYFQREELLVRPLLQGRLSGKDVATLTARVDASPAAVPDAQPGR